MFGSKSVNYSLPHIYLYIYCIFINSVTLSYFRMYVVCSPLFILINVLLMAQARYAPLFLSRVEYSFFMLCSVLGIVFYKET